MGGRKETIHGAFHRNLQEEIKRVMEEMKKFNIEINKLEATAIIAERSNDVFWDKDKALKILRRLRGVY